MIQLSINGEHFFQNCNKYLIIFEFTIIFQKVSVRLGQNGYSHQSSYKKKTKLLDTSSNNNYKPPSKTRQFNRTLFIDEEHYIISHLMNDSPQHHHFPTTFPCMYTIQSIHIIINYNNNGTWRKMYAVCFGHNIIMIYETISRHIRLLDAYY